MKGAKFASIMPDTLHEKALAQPFRVGLMLGALTVPALWVASEDILRIATSYRLLNSEEVTGYFASGALPGMVLGAGAVRAWAAWRARDVARARGLLLVHGGLVTLVSGYFSLTKLWHSYLNFGALSYAPPTLFSKPMPQWFELVLQSAGEFPLQLGILMLLLGLFMRGSRA